MSRRLWTAAEARIVFEMRDNGDALTDIAATLDRPYASVASFLRDEKRRALGAPVRSPLPKSCPDFEASILLGQRVNLAITRHAIRSKLTIEQAMRELLGGICTKPIPGTEVIHKTSSIQRRVNSCAAPGEAVSRWA